MKMIRLSFFIAALFALAPVAHATEWEMVWNDEFTSSGLPDASKWGYEEGFVRNQEKQYYTRGRLENARVENGMLIIEGRKEKYPNARYWESQEENKNWANSSPFAEYTAASLITKNKAEWLYGRIEVRAELPSGLGVWPAIWTLGANYGTAKSWPDCGEVDIMEFVGHDPKRIHATVHYGANVESHKSNGAQKTLSEPVSGFHVYAIEWFPNRIDFYFDKEKYHTFQIDQAGVGEDNPFRHPQYLLLNLALGGSWGKEINDANLPQKYKIDYVRVYREKPKSAQK